MSATELLTNSLANFINIYLLLIFVRLILSWFQTVEVASQAISFLSPVTDPYLNIFRSFVPSLGGIDLSPILAIIVLQLIGSVLTGV